MNRPGSPIVAGTMSKRFSFSVHGSTTRAVVLVAACIVAVAAFRVARAAFLPEIPNFAPVAALAFCGGLFLPGLAGWILPMVVLAGSDLALSALLGYPVFSGAQSVAWLCTLAVIGLGRWLSASPSLGLGRFFGSVLGGSVLFYLVTNTAGWLANPAYARGLSGLWTSLTVGVPGYPPTWMFFRNSAISDLIFAGLVLAVWVVATRSLRRPAVALA